MSSSRTQEQCIYSCGVLWGQVSNSLTLIRTFSPNSTVLFYLCAPSRTFSLQERYRCRIVLAALRAINSISSRPWPKLTLLSTHKKRHLMFIFFVRPQGVSVLTEPVSQLDILIRFTPNLSQLGFEPLRTVSQTVLRLRIFSLCSNLCALKGSNLGPSP